MTVTGADLAVDAPDDGDLRRVLEDARAVGFLGPGPVEVHVRHALVFAAATTIVPTTAVDLGAGGGIPGLALARAVWPACSWVLMEASERRCDFLHASVTRLGLAGRVDVAHGRVEELAHQERYRFRADIVIARSFGAPAVTAECGAPLLRTSGQLIVSDPPNAGDGRWPAEGLRVLGLAVERRVERPVHITSLRADSPCPDEFPRRVGVPAKRPLF